MKLVKPLAACLMALSLVGVTACVNIPKEQTVAQYCANPKKADENVCRLKVEIDGTSTALAETNLGLTAARGLAETAQASADKAQSTASIALARAEEALARKEQMVCETRTVQKTNIGPCREGYAVASCTQTRFTYRAGGPSILREINDEQCRFNDRVLEMQVRCCGMASSVPTPENAVMTGEDVPAPKESPTIPATTSSLRYIHPAE